MSEEEPDIYENAQERRSLRFEYRQLIANTEGSKEELIHPNSSGLRETLAQGENLFTKVRRTREAALDSQFLVVVSNFNKEQTQHFQPGIFTFDTLTFADKLVAFLGGRNVNEDSDDDEAAHNRRVESLDWSKLGDMAVKSFNRTPAAQFMYGPISMDAPVRKAPQVRNKPKDGEKPGSGAKTTPQQLTKVENNNEEATTKEVQRVLEALERVTDQGQDREPKPVYLFPFVTNPQSFSQSVENIFHLSFLINKGSACIDLDKNGLPIVYPTEPYSEQDYRDQIVNRKQVVMPFDKDSWKEIIEIYKVKKPMISTRKSSTNQIESDEEMEEE